MRFVKKLNEALEGFGLLAEVAGRAEQRGQPVRERIPRIAVGRQQAGSAQIANGAFDVGPGGVLREDGANDDFEAGAAGPPMLRAVGREKRFEIARGKATRGTRGYGSVCRSAVVIRNIGLEEQVGGARRAPRAASQDSFAGRQLVASREMQPS